METNSDKRPNAALINREWFESAASVLDGGDLREVLFSSVCYVIYGDMPVGLSTSAEIVFRMIKPSLDSDIAKYAERCERNAANARRGSQPLAATRSQSPQSAANTTTTITTTTTTTPISLTTEDEDKKRKRDMWLCYGYFWSIGSKAVQQELNAFWSYYESLGWKNNKGAAIVSRLACARMWRRQFEGGTPPDGAVAWFGAVKECSVPDLKVWNIYAGAEIRADGLVIRLRCTPEYYAKLVAVVPNLEQAMMRTYKSPAVHVEYIH